MWKITIKKETTVNENNKKKNPTNKCLKKT